MATNENSVVCDPFAGSATSGIAANLLGRNFIGIEKESEFIEICKSRKDELSANFNEFYKKIADLRALEN